MNILWLPFRLLGLVRFLLWFGWQLTRANVYVAWEVVTPRHRMRPAIVAYDSRCRSDLETVLLANLISLTPGTLTLEIGEDSRRLYVHALHLTTPEDLRRDLERYENELFRVTR